MQSNLEMVEHLVLVFFIRIESGWHKDGHYKYMSKVGSQIWFQSQFMSLVGCELGLSKIASHIIAHYYYIGTKLLVGQSNLPPTCTTHNLQTTMPLINTNEVNKTLRGINLFTLIHFTILHWKEKQSIYHIRQIVRDFRLLVCRLKISGSVTLWLLAQGMDATTFDNRKC